METKMILESQLFWIHYFGLFFRKSDKDKFIDFGCAKEEIEYFNSPACIEEFTNTIFDFQLYNAYKLTFNCVKEGGLFLCHSSYQANLEIKKQWLFFKDECLMLGFSHGNNTLPVFRIEEVEKIYSRSKISDTNNSALNFLPLLLFSYIDYRSLTQDQIVGYLKNALVQTNLFNPTQQELIISELAQQLEQEKESIKKLSKQDADYIWKEDQVLGWINNFPNSFRNPENSWTKEDFIFFKSFIEKTIN